MVDPTPPTAQTTHPVAQWGGHASDRLHLHDDGLSITFSEYFHDSFVNIEVVEPSGDVRMLSLDADALAVLIAWATKMRTKILEASK